MRASTGSWQPLASVVSRIVPPMPASGWLKLAPASSPETPAEVPARDPAR